MEHLIEQDRQRIAELGGPAKVAEMLRFEKGRGTQRVHNWCSRGIPAAVKVRWPNLFMVQASEQPRKAA